MTETKTPSNSRDDVLQFLETLDTYSQTTATANPATGTPGSTPADTTQSVLDFLDQITQSTPASNPSDSIPKQDSQSNASVKQNSSVENKTNQAETQKQSGAWSWGGLLATATTAYQTASTVVDNSVKEALETFETVRTNEATKKLEEKVRGFVNKEAIEKIGSDLKTLSLSTLSSVVNAVVPPISQYEVVEVWLSHDMVGYVGLESLVYRAFMKVMEQVEGGDVVVRKSDEIKRDPEDESRRDLNVCEGFIEAVGLAKANNEQVIKKHYKPPQIVDEKINDTEQQSICPVFMAIQPTKANPYSLQNKSDAISDPDQYLFYVIVLTDPTHNLTFKTFSQALPVSWLDVPYEENEWVEAKMVSVIKLAVQSIAQDYVWHRMTATDGQNQSNIDNSNIAS
ncbi:15492_t:CDS:2 [Dentiscutata erythropus]|uniref:15492_t:CDS:1 n=1 Tax=Dentiscutata erythropus TaxID=1348616 RepID=A0A9N9BSC6_9GLOM|nr:15492_t:CDS:2 [Dentiscutata erythropus]